MKPKTPIRPRHWVLGSALAATVGATVWTARGDLSADPTAEPALPIVRAAGSRATVEKSAGPASVRSQAGGLAEHAEHADWTPRPRAPWPAASGAYYSAWMPPPPPPPPAPLPPPPPPPPVAPQFPYQLIGVLEEDGQTKGLLGGQMRSIAVSAGEVVDGQWKVEQVSSQGLRLTWLPSQLPQTVAFRPL